LLEHSHLLSVVLFKEIAVNSGGDKVVPIKRNNARPKEQTGLDGE